MPLVLTVLLLMLSAFPVHALEPAQVPGPLHPWIDWVVRDEPAALCTPLDAQTDAFPCVWATALQLELATDGLRFSGQWQLQRSDWVELPGKRPDWPSGVRVDDRTALVLDRDGRPALYLPAGTHRIEGRIDWRQPPAVLALPAALAAIDLRRDGQPLAVRRDRDGGLLLADDDAGATQADRLDIEVMRRISDEIPARLSTVLKLRVSGGVREATLGQPLPAGYVPLALDSPLPARLEADGRLRVQLRPGVWTLQLTARHEGPLTTLAIAAQPAPWPGSEIWSWDARPNLRTVTVRGGHPLDPTQTALPPDWRQLPSYLLQPAQPIELVENARGLLGTDDSALRLERTLWLDFDGHGWTALDHISGRSGALARLDALAPLQPGRISSDGEDQFISRQGNASGIELRRATLDVSAASRIEQAASATLPAVGWDFAAQSASTQLMLPAGWRLLAASGPDAVQFGWLALWNLLDLFLLLVIALACQRLWGWPAALLALLGLGLGWHESDLDPSLWLGLAAATAIGRQLTAGRLARTIELWRVLSWLALLLVVLNYAVPQLRGALYPQLAPAEAGGIGLEVARPAALPAAAPRSLALRQKMSDAAEIELSTNAEPRQRPYERYSTDVVVQTGPGLPEWNGTRIRLQWNGPLNRDASLQLHALGPDGMRLWRLSSVIALFGLLWLTRSSARPSLWRRHTAAPTLALLIGLPLASLTPPPASAADFPPGELLEELHQRLLEAPACAPHCATIEALDLQADGTQLQLAATVLAAESVAIPLPLPEGRVQLLAARLDADSAWLLRADDGRLYARIPSGRHTLSLRVALPSALATLDLPLALPPARVSAQMQGWRLLGVLDGRPQGGQLQLLRESDAAGGERLEPGAMPPYVRIVRELHLAASEWTLSTRIERLSQVGSAIALQVPLLPGEHPLAADLRTVDGSVEVTLAAQTDAFTWESTLERLPQFTLHAGERWNEVWRLDAAPQWHVAVNGLALVQRFNETGDWQPEWRPWPGESLQIRIERPGSAGGAVLTVDSVSLDDWPGAESGRSRLSLVLRASRGLDHRLQLPPGAILQEVSLDGRRLPLEARDGVLTIPLHPGRQTLQLGWSNPGGTLSTQYRTPAFDLGLAASNQRIALHMPADRWALWVSGPLQGPAVLFWGMLIVLLAAAVVLGRRRFAPLGVLQWSLLALGLTQLEPLSLLVLVGWFAALDWRARHAASLGNVRFNLLQLALILLSLLALTTLALGIRQGLLGHPDLQIVGNGSSARLLQWYLDRSGGELASGSVISAPLWLYRVLMLLWALWLAAAVIGWLRWAWTGFASGGVWRAWRRPRATAEEKAPPREIDDSPFNGAGD
ncbi:hypothetical protein [Plasticicumulans acidivorans]|uniref:Uncharacterized protein n=1 Tax=Plasticicumulans acidivorans TaxID=886464 RepID=A0A317MZJ3_9GAMM|nr:hypothetical protein [Plasticicumulans acidivorans]PWV65741.1 hypothetical protein C7443_101226 [Plasticicumulans acidivorans]